MWVWGGADLAWGRVVCQPRERFRVCRVCVGGGMCGVCGGGMCGVFVCALLVLV